MNEEIEQALRDAFEGGAIKWVEKGGGHFEVSVVSQMFTGLRKLERHRRVLRVLKPWMDGADAPVHAVDSVLAKTPEEVAGT